MVGHEALRRGAAHGGERLGHNSVRRPRRGAEHDGGGRVATARGGWCATEWPAYVRPSGRERMGCGGTGICVAGAAGSGLCTVVSDRRDPCRRPPDRVPDRQDPQWLSSKPFKQWSDRVELSKDVLDTFPDRVAHARGASAKVVHEHGSPKTLTGPPDFAVKFYTFEMSFLDEDGFVSHDGLFDILEYDDLDLMSDDKDMEKAFCYTCNNEEVTILNRKMNELKLSDLEDSELSYNLWSELQKKKDSSDTTTKCAGFKSKLKKKFGNILSDKLLYGICNVFQMYCAQVSPTYHTKSEILIFDLLRLFHESTQGNNSGLSDLLHTSIVSSPCEDILEFLDEFDDSNDCFDGNPESDDVARDFCSENGDRSSKSMDDDNKTLLTLANEAVMAYNIPIPVAVNMFVSRLVVEELGVFFMLIRTWWLFAMFLTEFSIIPGSLFCNGRKACRTQ
ncbi:hypothetical protein ACP70R_023130 [Stipagrostis hirtigluma subsp. patula]